MQTRNTIIMAILVVIVGSFVYFYEIRGGKAREEAEERARHLMAFEASQVTSLRIDTGDGSVTARRGDDDGWRIVAPVETPADDVEIDTLLQALQDAEHEREVVEEAEELEPYGLADPRIVVTVELEDGTSQSLLVGKATPVGVNVYMKRREEPAVHIVAGTAVGALEKDLLALRDKSILTFADSDLRDVELETPDYTAILERTGQEEGGWRLTSPLESRADIDTVDDLLRHLRTDEAAAFVAESAGEEELRRYGLDEPRIRLTLRTEDGAAHGLAIGDASEEPSGRYARRDGSDSVFVVPSGLADAIPGTLDALRNRAVVDVPRARLEAVEMVEGDERIRIERSGTEWRIVAPRELGADASAISELITDLVGLRADGFAESGGDHGLESSDWQIRIDVAPEGEVGGDPAREGDDSGDAAPADEAGRTVSFRIGGTTRVVPLDDGGPGGQGATGEDGEKEPVEARYVSTSGDPTVFIVPAADLENLRPDLFELRKKTLVEFRQADVTRLQVSRAEDSVTFERQEEGWRVAEPEAALEDGQPVTDLLWELNYLRMEGVEREWSDGAPDLSAYGLEPASRRIRAWVNDEVVADVRLGNAAAPDDVAAEEEAAEQLYVRVGDRPAIYRIAAGLETALDAALEAATKPGGS